MWINPDAINRVPIMGGEFLKEHNRSLRKVISIEDLMEVIKISPRGYCYGVVDALQIVRQAAKDPAVPRPIYVIGQIIHNRHAIDELTNMGVVTLDGPDLVSILEQGTEGTGIFPAHGV